MNVLVALAIGLVFGVGLIVSGMFNPAKVLGFLDLAGRWDPTLLVVMAAAVIVAGLGYALAKGREKTLLGFAMTLPAASELDRRLILGSLVFGVGWGLAGICPGPALVLLGTSQLQGLVFFLAMLAGMGIYEWIERARAQRGPAARNPA
jgi:uncharacterized membrane protein YedE/YeeE